jgi:tetratricopeptide (TPR) repeat protein
MADASRFLAKADEALKKRNYDYAIQMYETAMETEPGNADARRNFRIALVRKYDQEGYPRGIGLGGLKTMTLTKNSEKMLVETEKIVAKDPKSIKYNLRVAEILASLKHHDAAIAVLEFVIKTADLKNDKLAPAALSMLAREYSNTGMIDEANKMLNRAVRLAPNDKQLQGLQKEIAAKSYNKKVGTAKSSYELVQNRDEADLLEKMRKGVLTEEDANLLLAQQEEILEENPLDRRAIRNVGEILARRKKFLEAYDRLMNFAKLDPSASEIGDLAAKYKNQYFDSMIALCKKKAVAEPDKAAAYTAKERQLREERKKFQLEEYGRQVEAAPTDLDKRYYFATALFDAGDYQEAFKHFQKAVKSPKHSKRANLAMGKCLVKMDRFEMAEMAFQNVEKEILEGDEELRKDLIYSEADLMERRGERAAALERFRELYMEDMEFKDIEKRIEQLKDVA